nr:putative ribonuclease H-like domain-containing protein [Tanacetum cinerariifolium]
MKGIRRESSVSRTPQQNGVAERKNRTLIETLPATQKPCLKNTNMLAPGMYQIRTAHTQASTSKLHQDSKKTNISVSFSTGVIPTTSVSRPQLKSNPKGDRVLRSNSHGKKLEVEEHRRSVQLSKNKMPVTACTDNLHVKTVNVKSVSAMCAKCVMIQKHDLRVQHSIIPPISLFSIQLNSSFLLLTQ